MAEKTATMFKMAEIYCFAATNLTPDELYAVEAAYGILNNAYLWVRDNRSWYQGSVRKGPTPDASETMPFDRDYLMEALKRIQESKPISDVYQNARVMLTSREDYWNYEPLKPYRSHVVSAMDKTYKNELEQQRKQQLPVA